MAWTDAARAAALAVRRSHMRATKVTVGRRRVDLRYHNTNVVTFGRRAVILRTGGYRTVTTKRRMNQAAKIFGLGYGVSQKKFNWYVKTPKQGTRMMTGSSIHFRR